MMDTMEGNLLNAGRNVVEASIDEVALSIYGICGCVRRQLEGLQVHH